MIKKNQSSKKEYGSAVFDWYLFLQFTIFSRPNFRTTLKHKHTAREQAVPYLTYVGIVVFSQHHNKEHMKIKVKEAGCDGYPLQPTDDLIREKKIVSLLQFTTTTVSSKSRFSPLYYSYSAALREVRCFRKRSSVPIPPLIAFRFPHVLTTSTTFPIPLRQNHFRVFLGTFLFTLI